MCVGPASSPSWIQRIAAGGARCFERLLTCNASPFRADGARILAAYAPGSRVCGGRSRPKTWAKSVTRSSFSPPRTPAAMF